MILWHPPSFTMLFSTLALFATAFAHVSQLSPRGVAPHRGCATPSKNITQILAAEKVAQNNLAKIGAKGLFAGVAGEVEFAKVIPVYFHGTIVPSLNF